MQVAAKGNRKVGDNHKVTHARRQASSDKCKDNKCYRDGPMRLGDDASRGAPPTEQTEIESLGTVAEEMLR